MTKAYRHNCAKKIEKYYWEWKSPSSKKDLIWNNLKLIYLWFFIVIIGLFIWGLISLPRDTYYFVGIGLIVLPTILEVVWFYRTVHFKHGKPDSLMDEEKIVDTWLEKRPAMIVDKSRTLVFGFCKGGPYRHSESLLTSSQVMWIPWSYQASYISPELLQDLSKGISISDREVVFAGWLLGSEGEVTGIRIGRVDHVVFDKGILRVTVNLEQIDPEQEKVKIDVEDPNILCFYLE